MKFQINEIDFTKLNGLVPAIIQDMNTNKILMLGYMNKEAVELSIDEKVVWFFSRSKNKLWKKGETSGNILIIYDILLDCDSDSLLLKVTPSGPICHTGEDTCWGEINKSDFSFLSKLQSIINDRIVSADNQSYISNLFGMGINKIAQKVGEEAVELIIESKDNNDELFLNEASDLLFHYILLLNAKGFEVKHVLNILEQRNRTSIKKTN